MKCKILTMFATGAFAAAALPALADDWIMDQLARTDGYGTSIGASEPSRGAAGRSGHQLADDGWLNQQLQLTDGYAAPAAAPLPTGAQGRSGHFPEGNSWLENQLRMTDGSNAASQPYGDSRSGS